MRNRLFCFIFISVISLIFSCKKEPEPIYSDSSITGVAHVFNSYDNDTITVIATGPYGSISQVTDKDSRYNFEGLGNGTYRLDFMKDGYGTIHQYGIQLFGFNEVMAPATHLFRKYSKYEIPVFSGINFGVRPRAFPEQMCVIISSKQQLGYFPLLFYLSTDENVSYQNYQVCIGNYDVYGPFETVKDDKIYIGLNLIPFSSGSKVYLTGYVCNKSEYTYDGYIDRYLGKLALSTFEADKQTPVMNFIMP